MKRASSIRTVVSTSDEDLLDIIQRRLRHSKRITQSGWKVSRHGVAGLSSATAQKAALFALTQELRLLSVASEGFQEAHSNALAALAEVQQMPNRLRNASAPIARLPDELLSHIFVLGRGRVSSMSVSAYINSLSSTCFNFRRVALATPLLWSTICYDYPLTAEDPPSLEVISMFLERSGTHPLDLAITFEPRYIGELKRLLRLIQPHLNRCHRLELNLSNYTVELALPLGGPLRNLKILDLCVSDFSRNISEQPAVPIRIMEEGSGCQLQSLHLAGPYPFKRSHLKPGKLATLRYIADGTPFNVIARFAAPFHFLRSLEITMIHPIQTISEPYVLPTLQTLTIINLEAFLIMRYIEAPALRHLHLWIQQGKEINDAFSPLAFSTRHPLHFPELRTLSLMSSTSESELISARTIAEFIAAHPHLQALRLPIDSLGSDVLMMLATLIVDQTRPRSNLRLLRVVVPPSLSLQPQLQHSESQYYFDRPVISRNEGEAEVEKIKILQEAAELLTVFIRCLAPTLRVQVHFPFLFPPHNHMGMGMVVPDSFLALKREYPKQVECGGVFVQSLAELVDE